MEVDAVDGVNRLIVGLVELGLSHGGGNKLYVIHYTAHLRHMGEPVARPVMAAKLRWTHESSAMMANEGM